MRHRLIIFFLLSVLLPAGLFGQTTTPAGFSQRTITTELLKITAEQVVKACTLYGVSPPTLTPTTIFGSKYNVAEPGTVDYATLFQNSGGPVLRSVGINFSFLMGYAPGNTGSNSGQPRSYMNFAVLAFNAFLVLMIGFRWMSVMNEASKGKGGLEVIPLIGKLCMGLVVVYNIPFVYAISMTLKDVGEQLVLLAICDGQMASNLTSASPRNIAATDIRDQGIVDAVSKALAANAFAIVNVPPPDPASQTDPDSDQVIPPATSQDTNQAAINSGRMRLANLVAQLNTQIQQITNIKTVSNVNYATGSTPTVTTGTALSVGNPINYVGFRTGSGASSSWTIPDSDTSANPDTGAPAAVPVQSGSATSASAYLAAENNTGSGQQLLGAYNTWLAAYLRLQADTYSSDQNVIAESELGVPTNELYEGGSSPLGDSLVPIDQAYAAIPDPTDADTQNYIAQVRDQALTYFNNNLKYKPGSGSASDVPSGQVSPGDQGDPNTDSLGSIFKALVNIPSLFAKMGIGVAKFFWVPFVAKMANLVFSFTIEVYCYLLMLAYPFWFYKKTEKAFTGALDNLVAVSFTAMTFTLLTMMFEGFMGQAVQWVTFGSSAMGTGFGTAVEALHFYAPEIMVGRDIGISIGFAIAYMVGTAICFFTAPKIFKAFKEGSSVVGPMIMGAISAVAAGAVGAVLMGSAATGALRKLTNSSTAQAVKSTVGRGLSRVNESMGDPVGKIGGAMGRAGQALGNSKIGKGIGKVAGGIQKAGEWVAGTEIGQGIAKDAAAVGTRLKSIIDDPKKALLQLATSSFGRTAVVAAAAMSGDPITILKAAGAQGFTDLVANKNLQNPAAHVGDPGSLGTEKIRTEKWDPSKFQKFKMQDDSGGGAPPPGNAPRP